jgi:hypothetical protein
MQILGGIRRNFLLEQQELVEAADARDGAADRARREPARHELPREGFEIAAVERLDALRGLLRVTAKRLQVPRVIAEGVRRHPPHVAQVIEVGVG